MDVSPHALDVPDIDSYIGLMHTLFTLEDLYGLTVSESDEDICLKVDTSKGKDAHELWKMLYAWKEQADKLSSEEISKDKYDESGVTTTRNLILRKHGQKFHHRNLATLWSEYSKIDSNQINMDLFVAQPPINHSLTLKPLDYENNCSHTTVINLLSKDF